MSSPTLTDAGLARPSASSGSTTLHEADHKASTLIQPKDQSSIRRWFNVVRRVVFPNSAQKHSETSSSGKKSEESLVQISPPLAPSDVVVVPCGASNEDTADIEPTTKVEPAAFLKYVARNQQASSVLASAFASAPAKVDLVAAPEQATVASTPVSQSTELNNDDETMPPKPAKAKRSRKPGGPTMITPAMMQKIAKDNKKHQGASAREAEMKKNSAGTVASAFGVKGVRANPLRWSQD